MAEGEGSGSAERVTCDESDGWEGEVDDGGQKREEAFSVCVGIRVCFV